MTNNSMMASVEMNGECVDGENMCMTVLDIPWDDVLVPRILPYLKLQQIWNLRLVNKQFLQLVELYFSNLRQLDITECKKITVAAFQLMTQHSNLLQLLVLCDFKELTDDVLVPILGRNPRLVHLNLSACSGLSIKSLTAIRTKCLEINTLSFKECHWVPSASLEALFLERENLEVIDLTGCWELVDSSVITMVTQNCRLRWLSLARIYGITEVAIVELANFCPELEYLDIQGCWRVTDNAISILARSCSKLKILKVMDCPRIGERSLARLRIHGMIIDVPKPQSTYASLPHQRPPSARMAAVDVPINFRI